MAAIAPPNVTSGIEYMTVTMFRTARSTSLERNLITGFSESKNLSICYQFSPLPDIT